MKNQNTYKVINTIKRTHTIVKKMIDMSNSTYYSKSLKYSMYSKIFDFIYLSKAGYQSKRDHLKSDLLNDFASIQFMSQLSELVEYVPQFSSGRKDIPSFVMTDVGSGRRLDQILSDSDYELAEKCLIGLMKTLATIHKTTIGKESQFLKIREALGKQCAKGGGKDKLRIYFLNFIGRTGTNLKIDFIPHNFAKEIKEIFHNVYESETLLGLTHWDICPDNCMLVEGAVKLYDFEGAFYSNVLIDGFSLSSRFPSCWCSADIPQTIINKAEKEYRKILGQKVPEINDDSYYMKQKTIIMTYWLFEFIVSYLETSLKKDTSWGIGTMRQRILFRLELTTKILKEQKAFPEIMQFFDKLSSELYERWGKNVIKVENYNAFIENNSRV